jgi:ABC-type phosphate transport system substrate-binding protein
LKKAISLLILAFAVIPTLLPRTARAQEIAIIVNEANPHNEISVDDVVDYFMKRKKTWPDGTPVRFIDRLDDSAEKNAFLRRVLRKSSREIDLFWIGQKLHGYSAPIQLPSDSLTASIVSRFPGAIAYVSAGFAGAKGVKKVTLLDVP